MIMLKKTPNLIIGTIHRQGILCKVVGANTKKIDLFGTTKRYDIVVFNPSGELDILVECKAPSVKITQTTFDQIARYNLQLKSNYLMVTNGLSHIYCQMDYQNKRYDFLPELPNYTRQ